MLVVNPGVLTLDGRNIKTLHQCSILMFWLHAKFITLLIRFIGIMQVCCLIGMAIILVFCTSHGIRLALQYPCFNDNTTKLKNIHDIASVRLKIVLVRTATAIYGVLKGKNKACMTNLL